MTATLAERYVTACMRNDLGLQTRLAGELDAETIARNDRLNQPNALVGAALWYARRGIAVFPCEPRGKKPITPHGLKDATCDETQIRAWWAATPAANIGAPTGITFDVIDADGREGVAELYGGDVRMPEEIGHTLTSRTAGHHIFIRPTGQGNRAGIYPSVDFRGIGGYVIMPPSIGSTGKRYTWTRPLKLDS